MVTGRTDCSTGPVTRCSNRDSTPLMGGYFIRDDDIRTLYYRVVSVCDRRYRL